MSDPSRSTRLVTRIDAPPSAVYRALLDPTAVQEWMVPDGMTSAVHSFDAREGGAIRISLTYDEPTSTGKSSDRTDTYHGRFVRLVADRVVVQLLEFDSDDAAMLGEMTVRFLLAPDGNGTVLTTEHEDLPPGLSPEDNDVGWRMSLAKLAAFVERGG